MWSHEHTVGLIELSTSIAVSVEAPAAMPAGVVALVARLPFSGAVDTGSVTALSKGDDLERAAASLADAGVRALAFACTTGSLVGGAGFDQRLVARLTAETGLPATTTATAVVEALAAVGARRPAVGTPYSSDLDAREAAFLTAAGLEPASVVGLGIARDADIARLSAGAVKDIARRAFGGSGADSMFLSCTNLPTLHVLDELEQELGVPVVSSNAATFWHVLGLAGVKAGRAGLGRLLSGAIPFPGSLTTNERTVAHGLESP
jgi:maleate isomerase